MPDYKIGFMLGNKELSELSFIEPSTTFMLIKECFFRGHQIYALLAENLFLSNNMPGALAYKIILDSSNLSLTPAFNINLNDLDMVLIRQNPPININYIFSTYLLDYIDQSKTIVIKGLLKNNLNNFI